MLFYVLAGEAYNAPPYLLAIPIKNPSPLLPSISGYPYVHGGHELGLGLYLPETNFWQLIMKWVGLDM